ncbi:MAG: hypothetical protein CMQ38_07865 [Gammaproteobacteria bacterium]|nr:hypothetical protein [Gammaproteobacteria bacterium]|tara:strand:+ start:1433 stop:1891 length:459 start_codon:yes stop_codon:yes gene_type:complete
MKNVSNEKNESNAKNIVLAIVWVLVLGGAIFNSNKLLAHAALQQTTPENGAVMHQAPENLNLNFSEAVRLLQVSVIDSESHTIDINFRPTANFGEGFSVDIPPLSAETYIVNWTAMGEDSHRIEGEFSFVVDPSAMESIGSTQEMPNHDNAH